MQKRLLLAAGVFLVGCAFLMGCGRQRLKTPQPVEKEFQEVSVHDPSIIQGDDGEYYIFGSHLAVAKSSDLMNWSYVNQGIKNSNPVIPNVYKNMKEAFEWAHSNTFWAPDVVKTTDGSFRMYYCSCQGDAPVSCLGMAMANKVEGSYENQGILLKSGMNASQEDEDGDLYQAASDPNTVDPCVFYDRQGRLWMMYGSYSGGIFIKEMDAETGQPLKMGYGKKILGGNHLRIEAPYVMYNQDADYYYLFLSFGGLDSDGGYSIRVCRSKNPDGPYEDSMGQDMIECKGPANSTFSDTTAMLYGTKLMGGYKFLWEEGEEGEDRRGYLSPGHNSCLYQEKTGKYFIIYHTRFENSGEEHQVRVHQMFFNGEGWPVIAPYRYTGESLAPVTAKEAAGAYKLICHGRDINADSKDSVNIELKKNGKISGDVQGSYTMRGQYEAVVELDGKKYQGVFLRQWDEDGKKDVMTFTALNSGTGEAVWGSGISALEE